MTITQLLSTLRNAPDSIELYNEITGDYIKDFDYHDALEDGDETPVEQWEIYVRDDSFFEQPFVTIVIYVNLTE